ncbi:MAG: helix-turn-helix domain-containing protein [Elusimicrobiota bacterium]
MPYKILLVDDNKAFREELTEALSKYKITGVSNSKDALNRVNSPNDLDLVLLDQKLPQQNGTQIIEKMREKNPRLGIIILTGYSSKQVILESLRRGADDYVEKITDIKELKKRIEKVIESRAAENSSGGSGISEKIRKAKRFVNKNCYKKINLEDVAGYVNLSSKYLSRLFKDETGLTFTEYRLKVKIKEAKRLLKETDKSVNSIAYKLGYRNPESFMKIFKERCGKTPTQFRK